jgi:nicotinate-nucleotide adenylyltransferase
VHNGHLALAELARVHLKLDAVFFVPASRPPHKLSTVSAPVEDRVTMLRMALRDNPSFVLWDGELRRGGISYTVDTLEALRGEHPDAEFAFLIGSDNLEEIPSWRDYHRILSMAVLAVVPRPGYSLDIPGRLRGATIEWVPSPEWGVSSSMVRKYTERGLSCRYLVPEPVYGHITERRLYRVSD